MPALLPWAQATTFWGPVCFFSALARARAGASVSPGLCQSVTGARSDPRTISPLPGYPRWVASAFQPQGTLSLLLGPLLKIPIAETPQPRSWKGRYPGQPSNIPDSPHNNRHMCPAIILPCVPVGCVYMVCGMRVCVHVYMWVCVHVWVCV